MPDFNKMVADMMADLRAENARLVSALRQKEEEIRRSEEARIRLGADLNDLRAKVRALAADCLEVPRDLPQVLDMMKAWRFETFDWQEKPSVAKSLKDVVPGWVYEDADCDRVYCPASGFVAYEDSIIVHSACEDDWFPWVPIRFVGEGLDPKGAHARAR